MTDTIRIMPNNIDEQRGANRQQITYEGIMVPGQKGSNRAMMPTLRNNPWDMTQETDMNDFIPNKYVTNASSITVIPKVRNNNATTEYDNSYIAPPTNWRKITDLNSLEDTYRSQLDETVTRRIEAFSPGFGGAHGGTKAVNTGVFMVKDPNKGYITDRKGQPHQNKGPRLNNVDAPETTLKDTLAESNSGAINLSGLKDNRAWKDSNVEATVTNKSMNTENKYRGQPHRDLGMGNRKHKIQPWVTTKEMNEYSYSGNPTSMIPAHMSYDAVFKLDYNRETDGDRFGIAKAPVLAKISDGGKIIPDAEKLLVENYTTNPTGKSQGINRQQFIDGLTMDYHKLDFGGWFPGVKIGNGEDAKRSAEITIKEEMTVHGRLNVPLKRDNPNDGRIDIEANLKEETINPERPYVQRIQPQADILERFPVLTRTKNVEAPNPRLDTAIKIGDNTNSVNSRPVPIRMTSDLYPWIKDKGTPEDTVAGKTTQ
jgi:hypothetical protein